MVLQSSVLNITATHLLYHGCTRLVGTLKPCGQACDKLLTDCSKLVYTITSITWKKKFDETR